MDAALQKVLGELLLNAVPTILLFTLVWVCYRLLVHNPLIKVLEERHSKTEGAIAKAQADIASADAKTADYEQRLRHARAEVFKQQESLRKRLQEGRSTVLAQTREQAAAQVKAAKANIEKEAATAKGALQGQSEALAQEVMRAVLRTGGSPAARR